MDAYYLRTVPRILEYCGNGANPVWDCEFVVGGSGRGRRFSFAQNEELRSLLQSGTDVYRSLWSRRSSIFFLDLEFKNVCDADEVYRKGREIFREVTEPVYRELSRLLQSLGIAFVTVMTATGYHFVFKVPFGSQHHARLMSLGNPCPELQGQYAHVPRHTHRRRAVPPECGLAFDGMGRLAEFLVKNLAPGTEVPAAAGIHYERQVLLDLSTYADPLHMRFIRCPGSYHQKSQRRRFATLIRRPAEGSELGVEDAYALLGDPGRAAEYIASAPAAIPDGGFGTGELISRYASSGLYLRHREFDCHRPEAVEREQARSLLRSFSDTELGRDDGLKHAVLSGLRRGIHAKTTGYLVAERYRLADWSSPLMAWAAADRDGYNPFSRALFWARYHST